VNYSEEFKEGVFSSFYFVIASFACRFAYPSRAYVSRLLSRILQRGTK